MATENRIESIPSDLRLRQTVEKREGRPKQPSPKRRQPKHQPPKREARPDDDEPHLDALA